MQALPNISLLPLSLPLKNKIELRFTDDVGGREKKNTKEFMKQFDRRDTELKNNHEHNKFEFVVNSVKVICVTLLILSPHWQLLGPCSVHFQGITQQTGVGVSPLWSAKIVPVLKLS